MVKLNKMSFLFLTIAVIAKTIESIFITSNYFYSHYLDFTLILIIICPIMGVILSLKAKKGISQKIACVSNIICFYLFAPLAIFNFWIINFGK